MAFLGPVFIAMVQTIFGLFGSQCTFPWMDALGKQRRRWAHYAFAFVLIGGASTGINLMPLSFGFWGDMIRGAYLACLTRYGCHLAYLSMWIAKAPGSYEGDGSLVVDTFVSDGPKHFVPQFGMLCYCAKKGLCVLTGYVNPEMRLYNVRPVEIHRGPINTDLVVWQYRQLAQEEHLCLVVMRNGMLRITKATPSSDGTESLLYLAYKEHHQLQPIILDCTPYPTDDIPYTLNTMRSPILREQESQALVRAQGDRFRIATKKIDQIRIDVGTNFLADRRRKDAEDSLRAMAYMADLK